MALHTVGNERWLDSFVSDFQRRFLSLLAFDVKHFTAALALSIASADKQIAAGASSDSKDSSSGSAGALVCLPSQSQTTCRTCRWFLVSGAAVDLQRLGPEAARVVLAQPSRLPLDPGPRAVARAPRLPRQTRQQSGWSWVSGRTRRPVVVVHSAGDSARTRPAAQERH